MGLVFANFDAAALGKTMLNAALPDLVKGGKAATDFAGHEFEQYTEDIDYIQSMVKAGTLTAEQGQYYGDRRKLSMQAVLLTIEGLTLINVQNAINAALGALWSAVGAAISIK
jgi:hypothetical protein